MLSGKNNTAKYIGNGIAQFILYVIRIILVLVLTTTIFIYNTRDITKQFISEEQIKIVNEKK